MGQSVSKKVEERAEPWSLRRAVAAWWALPPPGRVDEHNREAASLAPDVFEGFRGEFTRCLETLPATPAERRAAAAGRLDLDTAPRLLVSHQTTLARAPRLGGASAPSPLALAASRSGPPAPAEEQVLTAQYSCGGLALLGRVGGAARSAFASAAWAGPRARATVQAELPRDARRPAAYGAEAVWCVGPATTSVRARSADRVLALAHMQALGPRVAAGAQWLRAADGTALQGALRAVLRGGNAVVAALATLRGPRALALSYTQRVTACLRATAALDVQPALPAVPRLVNFAGEEDEEEGENKSREDEVTAWTSCATVGCEYATSDGDRVVRAQVDTRGDCAVSVDEALDDAVRLAVSAQVNPFRHTFIWGVGLSCTS